MGPNSTRHGSTQSFISLAQLNPEQSVGLPAPPPMESTIAGAVADLLPDWTLLPEDVIVTVMGELDIPDLIRAGAVCAPWHSAYATFRRLRLPSPWQPPCLLYSCDAPGCDATALYCPSTRSNFRIPFPQLGRLSITSAHGWLVVADEVSNLHLMNPLTSGHVALPPITTLRGVEDSTSFDEEGNLAYMFHKEPGDATSPLWPNPVWEAADSTYYGAVLSCSPSSAGRCVVLLLHWPLRVLSYARIDDERWTWIPPGDGVTGLRQPNFYCNAAYNDKDGLFYVVNDLDSIYALDLNGPSPVVRRIISELRLGAQPCSRYLIHAPWGELLQAWRFREDKPSTDVDDYDPTVEFFVENQRHYDPPVELELRTDELQLYRVDCHEQRLVKVEEGLGHHALFLGYNGSLCLPVTDFPGLKPNCAYITDDAFEFINNCKRNKREIGVWDIERQRLQSFDEASNLKVPWLNWPPPIWITPSLL